MFTKNFELVFEISGPGGVIEKKKRRRKEKADKDLYRTVKKRRK